MVLMAVYLKAHVVALTSQEIKDKGWLVKDIYVVVATGESKKCMPNPQWLVNNYLKDDAPILVLIGKLSLPCNMPLFLIPMHVV
jgi:hypothetical protein